MLAPSAGPCSAKVPARSRTAICSVALCRCGGAGIPPFCDGTHKKRKFDGRREK
ncbi:CDGSH iron-sulfur domain-containing protein [Rhodococcus sp. 24CO]|uniref:CDGSH iron-sulfur domain-containing protein n=1 Tax=Rhodococcus sp. 24CO TaxID=3117460 RepID=UPI003D3419D7